MKMKFITLILMTLLSSQINAQEDETIYQFKVNSLEGSEFDFSALKGKKIMVVNTASKCGLTPQYEQLQALYEEYKDKGLVVLGFPCNQFLGQEPGDNDN